jgi:hypothetical protein
MLQEEDYKREFIREKGKRERIRKKGRKKKRNRN